jgi:hypothetical protein
VSYQDGFGLMSYNSKGMNEVLATYSYRHWSAIAFTYVRDGATEFYVPRLNFLLKRWNEPESQANVYLSAGSGLEKYGDNTEPVHLGELVMDWESRKYYTYFEHLYLRRSEERDPSIPQKDYQHTKARLGFAPFLADYEDLNIWFIAQFDKHLDNKQIGTTQFLRFYRKNVLWEVGADFKGNMAFNFMIHI